MNEYSSDCGRSPGSDSTALCVDLDGTLLKSDLLYESLLLLLSKNLFYIALLPIWLLRGKAAFKHEIASRVSIDPGSLPYDERILARLRSTDARPRVLCTASNIKFAKDISQHLDVFELVLSSTDTLNLSGHRKADALVERFGERGFDYVGNDEVDLRVWSRARRAWVVNAGPGLATRAAKLCEVAERLPPEGSGVRTWIKALRIHQWLKNLLVFVPLLASHRFFDAAAWSSSLIAFLAFSLCASGVYILNDLLDLPSDRRHPRKRLRPFAAGRLPLSQGLLAAVFLAICGFALAALVGPVFVAVLVGYYAMTLAYSLRLKRVVMVDVVLLATLYTMRIIGGAAALNAGLSFWLLAFSMFIFLSLAMLKRYTELAGVLASGQSSASGRGYAVEDLSLIQSLGASSGYIAVMVLALYINSPESVELYARPEVLWLLCPMLLYWISRMWIISHRGRMDDDPIVFAVSDRASQVVILICGVMILGAI